MYDTLVGTLVYASRGVMRHLYLASHMYVLRGVRKLHPHPAAPGSLTSSCRMCAHRDTLRSNQHHGGRLSEGAERVVAGIGAGLDCNEHYQVGTYLAMTDGGLSS